MVIPHERYEKIRLSEKDRKIIKYGRRIGYLFSAFILVIGVFLNLVLYVIKYEFSEESILLWINMGILTFCFLVSYLMNRKLNKDLRWQTVKIVTDEVVAKEEETSYEAGSGSMSARQKMRPSQKYYIIVGGYRYGIEKDLYEELQSGDLVEFHSAKYSGTPLDIRKVDNHSNRPVSKN